MCVTYSCLTKWISKLTTALCYLFLSDKVDIYIGYSFVTFSCLTKWISILTTALLPILVWQSGYLYWLQLCYLFCLTKWISKLATTLFVTYFCLTKWTYIGYSFVCYLFLSDKVDIYIRYNFDHSISIQLQLQPLDKINT